jgi:sugar phosphate isomerase/epimerase
MISRRSFLATAGAFAGIAACRRAALGLPLSAANRTAPRRLERIGIQLYTVRREMQRDMPGTIAAIAAMGYREVEFAGYFDRSNAEVRQMLAANNLTSPSTHIGFDQMKVDWGKTFDDALAKGHQFITVPSPPNGTASTVDAWRRVADDFNRAGERARGRGLGLAYHNHYTEFTAVDGQRPIDVLLANTDPKLVSFEMDVFWVTRGGGDPRALIRQHPTRFTMLHIKDSSGPPEHNQVDVGAGKIDFAGILKEDLAQKHVVQHVFVEHDQPVDPMLFAKEAYDYLSAMEY